MKLTTAQERVLKTLADDGTLIQDIDRHWPTPYGRLWLRHRSRGSERVTCGTFAVLRREGWISEGLHVDHYGFTRCSWTISDAGRKAMQEATP